MPADGISAVYAHDSRALVRLDDDSNGDGRIDARTYMRDGRPVRFEADTNADGLIDRREVYRANALLRTESDTNQDGLTDRWEEYRDGSIVRLLLDDERRLGRPTRRIVYDGHEPPRIETDLDGDGTWEIAGQS